MRYRNVKTGIEFTSSCAISGADFVEVKAKTPEVKETKAEPKPKTTTKRTKK